MLTIVMIRTIALVIGRVILEIAVRKGKEADLYSTVYEASSSAEGFCRPKVRLPRPHSHQLRQAIVQVSVTSPQHQLTLDWLLGKFVLQNMCLILSRASVWRIVGRLPRRTEGAVVLLDERTRTSLPELKSFYLITAGSQLVEWGSLLAPGVRFVLSFPRMTVLDIMAVRVWCLSTFTSE